MQKLFLFLLFFGLQLCNCINADELTFTKKILDKHFTQKSYRFDSYKNVHIHIANVDSKIMQSLKMVRDEMTEKCPKIGIFIHMPIALGKHCENLKKYGFNLYAIDRKENEILHLYNNGRAIPNVYNSFAGNAVFIFRINPDTGTKELLVVNDVDKPFVNVVGGCVDDMELVADGAVREIKEEIGLTVKAENLRLLVLANTVREDVKTNCLGLFYVCEDFEGTPKPDSDEIQDFAWVTLEEVLRDDFEKFGKKFNETYKRILRNAYNSGALAIRGKAHEYQVSALAN